MVFCPGYGGTLRTVTRKETRLHVCAERVGKQNVDIHYSTTAHDTIQGAYRVLTFIVIQGVSKASSLRPALLRFVAKEACCHYAFIFHILLRPHCLFISQIRRPTSRKNSCEHRVDRRTSGMIHWRSEHTIGWSGQGIPARPPRSPVHPNGIYVSKLILWLATVRDSKNRQKNFMMYFRLKSTKSTSLFFPKSGSWPTLMLGFIPQKVGESTLLTPLSSMRVLKRVKNI